MIGYLFIKILIKFIDNTEIFYNFGFGYHSYICDSLLIVKYKHTHKYFVIVY